MVPQPDPQQTGDVWGDEADVARAVLDWASTRAVRPGDPKTTALPASVLAQAAGATITPNGIGGHRALRIFAEVLAPATRAQDDPMNLAYIPSAPTRAAVAFDAATSAANIFGGIWETGAGAIFAENEALSWLISLLGWPATTAAGVFVAGGTMGNLSALHAARCWARDNGPPRSAPAGWLEAGLRGERALLDLRRCRGPRRRSDPRPGGRRGPAHRRGPAGGAGRRRRGVRRRRVGRYHQRGDRRRPRIHRGRVR